MWQLLRGKQQQHLPANHTQIIEAAIGAVFVGAHVPLVQHLAQLLAYEMIQAAVDLRMLVETNGKRTEVQHNYLIRELNKATHIAYDVD